MTTTVYSPEDIVELARHVVKETLEADRANRKLGRDDRGTGSEYVGSQLRIAREESHLSQRELAQRAGLHPTTIGKIELGERGMSLSVFCRLVLAFPNPEIGDNFMHNVVGHFG